MGIHEQHATDECKTALLEQKYSTVFVQQQQPSLDYTLIIATQA
uniref:Uncharacterized protein n=1 Tax=Arundo donax TaxID=35708 RepID=A0A0A9FQA5_ARUDO